MRVRLNGLRASGRAVDARGFDLRAADVVAAIRHPGDDRVRCRRPGPVHDHAGLLAVDTAVEEAAVAAVTASWGMRVPTGTPPPDTAVARRAVAQAETDVVSLRERVERASGRLEALRSVDAPTEDATGALREATLALTDAETERVAARQRLAEAEARLRRARDDRERVLRRADARRNRARARIEARAALARPLVDRARVAVPDWNATALAVVRAARVRAPIVLVDGPFRRAEQAAGCLNAPVLLL